MQTGRTPPELENLVEFPACMRDVWVYFSALDSRRGSSGFGPLPLQYSEINSYFKLYKIEYDQTDIDLILLLDDVTMEHYNKKIAAQQRKGKK